MRETLRHMLSTTIPIATILRRRRTPVAKTTLMKRILPMHAVSALESMGRGVMMTMRKLKPRLKSTKMRMKTMMWMTIEKRCFYST
jgi:hypothetical protein